MLLRSLLVASGAVALTAESCAAPGAQGSADTARDTAAARARLVQLETDARALAKTTGCNTSDQCRTAPVGSRPCGGPRAYVVYCAATTDSAALYSKLDELKAAETKFNQAAGMASTCEFRMPPTVSAQGGSCREGGP
jgi:hypothetical protein